MNYSVVAVQGNSWCEFKTEAASNDEACLIMERMLAGSGIQVYFISNQRREVMTKHVIECSECRF